MKSYQTPDYSKYTLKELEDVYYVVDRKQYPDNFKAIVEELEKRKSEIKVEKDIETESAAPAVPEAEAMPLKPTKKLPIQKIVKNTVSEIWEHKYGLLSVLILPYLLIILLEIVNPLIFAEVGMIASIAVKTVKSIIYAAFAVTCHRYILLGKGSVPKFGLLIPSGREIRFWGWTIGFGLFAALIMGSVMFALGQAVTAVHEVPKEILVIIVIIPGCYVLARWILIFPAVALDERPSISWSWKQSRTNGPRLFLMLAIPVMLVLGMNFMFPEARSLLFSSLSAIISFVLTVGGIALISLSYKELYLQDSTDDIRS